MFEGLTEFCFVFRFGFHTSLLAFTSRIERLWTFATIAQMYVLAHFGRDTVAHVHWQAGQVRSSTACLCRISRDAIVAPSGARPQPWLLQRLLGLDLSHAVHWCVTHCRQAVCSALRPVITLQSQCWR